METASRGNPAQGRVNLKEPALAALLAWMIPGLGHFYQGRFFKAVLYFVCILSTFFFGNYLADGKAVYFNWDRTGKNGAHGVRRHRTYAILGEIGIGLVAMPAIIQHYRLSPAEDETDRGGIQLERPLAGKFEGIIKTQLGDGQDWHFPVTGTIEVEPVQKNDFRSVAGKFVGEVRNPDNDPPDVPDHTPVEVSLTLLNQVEPRIFPSPDRKLELEGQANLEGQARADLRATLSGKVLGVRKLVDRFEAPLDDAGLQDTYAELGGYYDLGVVYALIAAFLNILAIWDAFEGPAYGYGDEESCASGDGTSASLAAESSPGETGKPKSTPTAPEKPARDAPAQIRTPPRAMARPSTSRKSPTIRES